MPGCRAALSDPAIAVVWLRAQLRDVWRQRFAAAAIIGRPTARHPRRSWPSRPLGANRWWPTFEPTVIDVDELPPDAVVARVLEALG